MLFAPASAGDSKFGPERKESTPVDELTVNLAASAPPTIEYDNGWAGRSPSVAVTVVTAVTFSVRVIEALAPPPFEVTTGLLSLSPLIRIVKVSAAVEPSWDVAVTSIRTLAPSVSR